MTDLMEFYPAYELGEHIGERLAGVADAVIDEVHDFGPAVRVNAHQGARRVTRMYKRHVHVGVRP